MLCPHVRAHTALHCAALDLEHSHRAARCTSSKWSAGLLAHGCNTVRCTALRHAAQCRHLPTAARNVYPIVAEASRTSSACGSPRDAKPLQPSESTTKAFGGSAHMVSFSALQQKVAKSAPHADHVPSSALARTFGFLQTGASMTTRRRRLR
jgi:hypothetical protein